MEFENRIDAARQLAKALKRYQGLNPLVLAIPRGAVPMGNIIAEEIGGQLDTVLVRKIGAPNNPEFAVGSVGESGKVYMTEYPQHIAMDSEYLSEEVNRQLQLIKHRRREYDRVHASIEIKGRIVIVVDDGLATGATMRAALQEVRAQGPSKLICATPVASVSAENYVRFYCDELVCLSVELSFSSVGQFYRDFAQVEDEDVVRILSRWR